MVRVDDHLNAELWKACAGPFVHLPSIGGDRVYYFPQGHSEQCETTQRVSNMPSKILCQVIDIQLLAEQGTDDVYAQVKLLPEADETEPTIIGTGTGTYPTEPLRPTIYSFNKILTASDVGKRYELNIRKDHAHKCLPPLDMSANPREQLLVAKDIHGIEWKFKHTFSGKNPRHTLTSGWYAFATSKNLAVGDTFVLLRGEDGELRVGVRRLDYPKCSFLSSGAAALEVPLVGSAFVVDYKPRLGQFIVPLNKYAECVNKKFSIGMKIKMPFGDEGSTDKGGFSGTIIGIGDIISAWRCLKIQWDGSLFIGKPENVSPWEIQPVADIQTELHKSVLQKGKRKLCEASQEELDPDMAVKYGFWLRRASSVDPTTSNGNRTQGQDTFANLDPIIDINGLDLDMDKLDALSSFSTDNALVSNDYTDPLPGSDQDNLVYAEESSTYMQPLLENMDSSNRDNSLASNEFAILVSDSEVPKFTERTPDDVQQPLSENTGRTPLERTPDDVQQPLSENTGRTPLERTPTPVAPQDISCATPSIIPYNGPGCGNELVPWGRYLVARRNISILDMINTRYPEMLSSLRDMSKKFQFILLDFLAEVVYLLENPQMGNINRTQLDDFQKCINDLKVNGIEVNGIEHRLQDMEAQFRRNILVQRQAKLKQEVEMARVKYEELVREHEVVGKELDNMTSTTDTDSLIADQQGLL